VDPTTPSVATSRSHTSPVEWTGRCSIYSVIWSLHVSTHHPGVQCRLYWSSKGEEGCCDTSLSSVWNQVVGKTRLERKKAAREDCDAPPSLLLSDLERLSCRIGIVPASSAHPPSELRLEQDACVPTELTTPLPSVTPPRQHPNEVDHFLE
jgi:hypothetical protein